MTNAATAHVPRATQNPHFKMSLDERAVGYAE